MEAYKKPPIQEKILRVKSLKELARAVRGSHEAAVYEAPAVPEHLDFEKFIDLISPVSVFGGPRGEPHAINTSDVNGLKAHFKKKKKQLLSTSGALSTADRALIAQCIDFIAADTIQLLSHFPNYDVYLASHDFRIETTQLFDPEIQNFHTDGGRNGYDCIRIVRMYRGPSTIYKSTGPWTTIYSGRDGSISAHRISPTTVQHRAPLARENMTRYAAVLYLEKPRA